MKKSIFTLVVLIVCSTIMFAQPNDYIVYYPFNGNANDASGNGKNATVTGATLTTDRLGNANCAYSFDGTNDIINMPNTVLPNSNAYSISFWVKINGDNSITTAHDQVLLDLRGQYQIYFYYYESTSPDHPNTFYYGTYNTADAEIYTPNNFVQTGKWYNLVGTFGNNTVRLYIDGVEIANLPQIAPGAVSGQGFNNSIGKDYNTAANRMWVNGSIDDVKIYNREITPTEVNAIYNEGPWMNSTNGIYYSNGTVSIGTPNAYQGSLLTVKGKIVASELQVIGIASIPDYVFDANYKLKSLKELENFVKINKHLPEIPSEAEFKQNGMNLLEMNTLLLKKVEELTLYMIELKNENEKLKEAVELIKNK